MINKAAAIYNARDVLLNRIYAKCQSRPRIGYIGWQNQGNLGDDVLFEAITQLFPSFNFIEIKALTLEKALAKKGLSGHKFFDAVMLGGGTLINPLWIELVQYFLREDLPMWAFGTGVGSVGFAQPKVVQLTPWKETLEQFSFVGVRGFQSQKRLQSLGVKNVDVIGDPALALTRTTLTQPSFPRQIAVNVSLPEHQNDDGAYFDFLAVALNLLIENGYAIVPFAMAEADIKPIEQLLHKLSMNSVEIPLLKTAEEFFHLVSPCTFTVTVRLHGAILSCCAGVPPLMLGYRDKCADFMETVDMMDWYIELDGQEASKLAERILFLSKEAELIRPSVLEKSMHWRKELETYSQKVSLLSNHFSS